jgi:hypothetical protein
MVDMTKAPPELITEQGARPATTTMPVTTIEIQQEQVYKGKFFI